MNTGDDPQDEVSFAADCVRVGLVCTENPDAIVLKPGPGFVTLNTNGVVHVIPADEPVFLIRAQDIVSGDAVRVWANLARLHGASQDILDAAERQAKLMDQWPKKKVPDLPQSE